MPCERCLLRSLFCLAARRKGKALFMKSDIFLQIKLKYNTLTTTQKKLADFVLSNPDFVLNQSISEVAGACNVGEATITRFCKCLGLKSYHEFKLSIVACLPKEQLGDSLSNEITEEDSITVMAKSILAKDIEALNETHKLIKEGEIKKAVDLLLAANRIIFYGFGSSFTAALEGCNKFMRITPNASINFESHMQYITASLMSENDVAVIISYSGSTKESVEIARTASSRGAKIICITRYLKSPLTHYSDVSLLCSTSERLVHGQSISMELAQIFLLDVLYTEFFRRSYERSQENKDNSTSVLSDKLF